MPLFRYRCRTCETQMEIFVQHSDAPRCPKCEGTALDKQFTAFAVRDGGPREHTQATACGKPACAGGMCQMMGGGVS